MSHERPTTAMPSRECRGPSLLDRDLLASTRKADARFRTYYGRIFQGLSEAGHLRPIWSAEEATEAAYATTLYGVFLTHLRNMRDWSPAVIEDLGMKVLRTAFLSDEALQAPTLLRGKESNRVRRQRPRAS